ncbi:hemocytin-like isoform X2 [Antedon mediterranea]
MEDGSISDNQISVSSYFSSDQCYEAAHARLNTLKSTGVCGSWVAWYNDQNQWIQVDFGVVKTVTGVITQGRNGYPQWVTSYEFLYSMNGTKFQTIKDANEQNVEFEGNSDKDTKVTNMFSSPVSVRVVRIHPTNWCDRISMRFELLGCKDGLIIYNHHCYKYSEDLLTWSEAKAVCENSQTHLITINTEEELNYFVGISIDKTWTGLNDIEDEGNPVWLIHEQPPTFDVATNSEDDDCCRIRTNVQHRIKYVECSLQLLYICEGSTTIYTKYSLVMKGKSPAADDVVRHVLAVSSGACSLECGNDDVCVSFSFNAFSNECILSTNTGHSSEELNEAEGFDFFGITSSEETCTIF